eukprot:3605857-Prymnesium_polylepis.1
MCRRCGRASTRRSSSRARSALSRGRTPSRQPRRSRRTLHRVRRAAWWGVYLNDFMKSVPG